MSNQGPPDHPPDGADSTRERRFLGVYDDAYEDVLRFAQRRASVETAEDVVAEAFLVVWRRLDEAPRRPDALRAWLFGIARHCLLNARRGQSRQESLAIRLADIPPPHRTLDPAAGVARFDLAVAWRRLTAEEQEVLALTAFEDLTSPQAGRVLGISSAAYRLRLMRARRSLRRHLETASEDVPLAASARSLQENQS